MLKTVFQTQNRKLVGKPGHTFNWSPRPVATTMRAAGPSCPTTCAFLPEKLGGAPGAGGCYAATGGPVYWQSKHAVPHENDGEVYRAFVKGLPRAWALRLHASGDFFKEGEVDRPYVDGVLAAHRERPDVEAWTYTHDWRALESAGYAADDFRVGGLTVNASCDTLADAHEAAWAGWPVVITALSGETRRRWREGELDVVLCPATPIAGTAYTGVACNTCMLCAKRERSLVVAFPHHGSGAKRADARLEALQALPMAGD